MERDSLVYLQNEIEHFFHFVELCKRVASCQSECYRVYFRTIMFAYRKIAGIIYFEFLRSDGEVSELAFLPFSINFFLQIMFVLCGK